MKNIYPKATRELEYVAFFDIQLNTLEGPAQVFMAVDAFSQFAFLLGFERDRSPTSILKNIYFLIENKDFEPYLNDGRDFTLVLEAHEELSVEIENIIKPVNGKLLFDKSFNNYLANPVLLNFRDTLLRSKS